MNDTAKLNTPYKVVGHRGYPEKYPENSLIGLVAAAKGGAHCVELDVQMSKDGVPMVFHDASLNRVCGVEGKMWDFSAAELGEISNHEPERFQDQFKQASKISTLEAVSEALASYDALVFIEIKKESFEAFSRDIILDAVLKAAQPIKAKSAIISFDFDIVQMAKQSCDRVGWVLSDMQQSTLLKAQMLNPNVLAYDVKKLSKSDVLWPGPWEWFLWDIVDPSLALEWADNGVTYIETWDSEKLMQSILKNT